MISGLLNFDSSQHADFIFKRAQLIEDAQAFNASSNSTISIPYNDAASTENIDDRGKVTCYEWTDAQGKHQYVRAANGYMSYTIFDENYDPLKQIINNVDYHGNPTTYSYSVTNEDGSEETLYRDYNKNEFTYYKTGDNYTYRVEDKDKNGSFSIGDEAEFTTRGEEKAKQEVYFDYQDTNGNGIYDDDILAYIDTYNEAGLKTLEEISKNFAFEYSLATEYTDDGMIIETLTTNADGSTIRSKYNDDNTERLNEIDNIDAPLGYSILNKWGKPGGDGRIDETTKEILNPAGMWDETELSFFEWLFQKG